MSILAKAAYEQGREDALGQLGGLGTAEDFASLAEQDSTEQLVNADAEPLRDEEKTPTWGSSTSLEGGDAGTRQEQMGIPATAAV